MVAERAGVSQTTVSFVLNKVEGQNISPETTNRVLQAAQELGYVPDAVARMLARGVSDNIAFVLTRPHEAVLSDEYVSYVLTGIAQVIRKESFRILVEFIDEDAQSSTYRNLVHGKEAVGLLVIPYNPSHHDIQTMVKLSEENIPIVTIGKKLDESIPSVVIEDQGGIQAALDHLYDMGHRQIGVISYAPKDSVLVPKGRLETYRQFLDDKQLAYHPEWVQYGAFRPESGYQAALRLLEVEKTPTAILALNDVMAFGAMTAIREHGLRVPEDIAIVGYDGIHLARYTSPSLTTVEAPNVEQGQVAADMLLKIINEQPIEAKHIQLLPKLAIRESCGHQ